VLRRASASAVGEISIPVTVVLRVGERRERRRRGMQPVPVQRSRMRICFGSVRREGVESRIEERRKVYSSVACLRVVLDRLSRTEKGSVVPWDQDAFSAQDVQVPEWLRA
jgi:hypothetical protein